LLFSHLSDDKICGLEKENVKSANGMVAKRNAVKNRATNSVHRFSAFHRLRQVCIQIYSLDSNVRGGPQLHPVRIDSLRSAALPRPRAQVLGAVPSWPLTAAIINTSPVIIGLTIRDGN
jgi:hypothetical protein